MGDLSKLGFGGTVSDKTADIGGEKLDTTPDSDKDQETQDKVSDAMENDEDISDDDIDVNTSDEEEEESDDEEEDEDEDDEESSEDFDDFSDEDDENSKSDGDIKPKEDEADKAEETQTGLSESEISTKLKAIESDDSLEDDAREERIMMTFLELNKTTIPESARANFQKYIDSGRNNAFIHADDSLHKLVNEIRSYRDDIPLSERITKAHKVVFSAKIATLEQKKGQVKTEIRTQQVNKAVSNSQKTSSKKSGVGELNAEQQNVFKKMGVPIKDFKKYGNKKFN